MRDPRLATIEAVIHELAVVPSKSALSSHHYWHRLECDDELDDQAERRALHITPLFNQLGSKVLTVPKLPMPGSPTAFVSRIRYPEADRRFVHDYLRPLGELGTTSQRRDVLEQPMPAALKRLLPEEYRVMDFRTRFHDRTNDVGVIGPDGAMFNIELRNRRTDIHDTVTPQDRTTLQADHEAGRIAIFVIPHSTHRFKEAVAAFGGVTIDTHTYLVASERLKQLVATHRWSCWPVTTPDESISRIAAQITDIIIPTPATDSQRPSTTNTTEDTTDSRLDSGVEIERILDEHQGRKRSRPERVEMALRLYDEGVPTMAEAAALIGCRRETLVRDFPMEGERSPWRPGGHRTGAGRKSK